MARWDGHVVWITGGGTGLGAWMARQFARDGAQVAISGRRRDRLEEVAQAITRDGGEAWPVVCDVTDEDAVKTTLAGVGDRFGRIDVVVANAGMSVSGRIDKLSMEHWRRQMDVNVCGAAITARHAVPWLRETKGRLALVGSVAATVHFAGAAPYQASKAAVAALGNSLWIELAKDGISVTTLHPGFVRSEIHQVDNEGAVHPEREDRRPAWLMWETEPAARVMCRAIHRRRRQLVFTWHGRLAWFLGQHFPGLTARLTRTIENRTAKA